MRGAGMQDAGLARNRRATVATPLYNPVTDLGASLLAWWDCNPVYFGANGYINVNTVLPVQAPVEGDKPQRWADIVSGQLLTASSIARPTYNASAFGGKPCMSYDGSANCWVLTLTGQFPAGAAASELWCLLGRDASQPDSANRSIVSYGASTVTMRELQKRGDAPDRAGGSVGTGAAATSLTGTNVSFEGGNHWMRGEFSPTTHTLTVDGVAEGNVGAVPNTTATRIRIGANSASSAATFFQGRIAAVLVTGPLAAGKAANVASWLTGRLTGIG